ncbi:MAG: PEGA domain-containing protein [Patescibacteria group bacterium]|nr:PEGA domain-containing protein [Patescibacteria group bacterium]
MHKAPFHRRILPLIFFVAFIAVAPTILFYTSGYRWNPKKGKVERNGTVIIDSVPTDATIYVDDRPLDKTTPFTIQDMAPGTHQFRIERSGYTSWSKSLDVYPEKVTFANSVYLWKQSEPQFTLNTPAKHDSISPDGTRLVLVDNTHPSSTNIVILTTNDMRRQDVEIDNPIPDDVTFEWSDNSRYAVIRTVDENKAWLIDSFAQHEPLSLPDGFFRWEGNQLIGIDRGVQTTLRTSDYSLEKTPLEKPIADASDTADLKTTTDTSALLYTTVKDPNRALLLPSGDWRFYASLNNYVLLNDGWDWLSLQPENNPPQYRKITGDYPRLLVNKKINHYLFVNGTEMLIWNPLAEPDLILRQSDRILDAAWHATGDNIFYATEKDVRVINLDPRDGREISTLASFDKINDSAYYDGKIFILATRGDQSGLWTLSVE